MKIDLRTELEFFTNALNALNAIPNEYRSQNHTAYKAELENSLK